MTDKPHARFALPGHGLVTLEGRDAVAFSHAQFMSDVKSLGDGQWHWSGWLTPKGRVVALFALLRRGPESVWLVLPDADRESFATALRTYVFRSKVAIATPEVAVSATFSVEPTHGRLPGNSRPWVGSTGVGIALDMSGEGGPRTLFIGGEPAHGDPAALARWTAADLAHGLPRLPASQAGKWTPQQLSLERLRAFSVKKGCYPGQEIVARTHFLGQAKRGLRLLASDVPAAPGDRAHDAAGEPLGEVVGVAAQADGPCLIQVVAPLDAPDEAFHVHGRPAPARAFLGGLARPA